MMNKYNVVLITLLLCAGGAAAYPSPREAPQYYDSTCSPDKHFVFDYVGYLPASQAKSLEKAHCAFYKETGAHFVIAITAHTDGESLSTYARGLFNYWGIGDKQQGDGLLLLYTQKDNEGYPGLYIGVGSGIDHVLEPSEADSIYEDALDDKSEAERGGKPTKAATVIGIESASRRVINHMFDHWENGRFYGGMTPTQKQEFQDTLTFVGKVALAIALIAGVAYAVAWMFRVRRERIEEEQRAIMRANIARDQEEARERARIEREARRKWEMSDDPAAIKWRKDRDEQFERDRIAAEKVEAEKAEVRGVQAATVSCSSCYNSRTACRHGYGSNALMNSWLTYFFVFHVMFPQQAQRSHASSIRSSSTSSDHSSSTWGGFGGGGLGGSFGGGGFGGGGGGRF